MYRCSYTNADPDMQIQSKMDSNLTARELASRHPYPRIRLLHSNPQTTPPLVPKHSSLQIRRSTLVSSDDKTSDEDDECYASLWDFVNSTESELTVVQDTEETAAKAHEGGEIGTP